jgi:tetratricopeptide (TPR) repeat protein
MVAMVNKEYRIARHASWFKVGQQRLLAGALVFLAISGCSLFDSDKARSWHAFRSSGQLALSKDDYAVAQTSFQSALKEVESLPHETLRQAISLKDLSAVCLHIQDNKLAQRITDKALALAGTSASDSNSLFVLDEVGQSLNNLGEYYFKQVKDFDKAALLYGKAEAIFENLVRRHPANPPDCFAGYHLGKSISGLGQAYAGLQKGKEAMKTYGKAADPELLPAIPEVTRRLLTANYAELAQVTGPDKVAYATTLGISISEGQIPESVSHQHLAHARQLIQLEQFPAAQAELLKAQMVAESLPQPSEHLAEVLQTLGVCYVRQLQYAQAEPILLRALSILEKTSAGDPTRLASCLYTIGTMYARNNEPEKAIPYALRRREIWLDAVGPADAESIKSNVFCGELYLQAKQLDKSLRYYNEAVDLLLKSKRVERRLLARAYTGAAQVLMAKGNYTAAKPLLEKALEIWRTKFETDPNSAQLTETLYSELKQHLGISSSVTTPDFHATGQAP